jgi:hypothetical protein
MLAQTSRRNEKNCWKIYEQCYKVLYKDIKEEEMENGSTKVKHDDKWERESKT